MSDALSELFSSAAEAYQASGGDPLVSDVTVTGVLGDSTRLVTYTVGGLLYEPPPAPGAPARFTLTNGQRLQSSRIVDAQERAANVPGASYKPVDWQPFATLDETRFNVSVNSQSQDMTISPARGVFPVLAGRAVVTLAQAPVPGVMTGTYAGVFYCVVFGPVRWVGGP